MKTFSQYIEEFGDDKLATDLGMSGAAPEESMIRIARLAIHKHNNDLMDFFRSLAAKDPAIRHELDNMNRNDANRPHRPKGKPQSSLQDKDEIVPSASDGLSGAEDGEM